jgi:hypothetical protein
MMFGKRRYFLIYTSKDTVQPSSSQIVCIHQHKSQEKNQARNWRLSSYRRSYQGAVTSLVLWTDTGLLKNRLSSNFDRLRNVTQLIRLGEATTSEFLPHASATADRPICVAFGPWKAWWISALVGGRTLPSVLRAPFFVFRVKVCRGGAQVGRGASCNKVSPASTPSQR